MLFDFFIEKFFLYTMKHFLFLDVGDTLLTLKENPGNIYFRSLEKYNCIRGNLSENQKIALFKDSWKTMSANGSADFRDRYQNHSNGINGWWIELIDTFVEKTHSPKIEDERVYEEIFSYFDSEKNWNVEESFFKLTEFCLQKSIGLGIISNWDLRLRGLLERLNLDSFFNPIIISAEFGFEKPSLKIFEEGMRRTASLDVEQYSYIGDKAELDYHPPRELGWNSYLLKSEKSELQTISKLIDIKVYLF